MLPDVSVVAVPAEEPADAEDGRVQRSAAGGVGGRPGISARAVKHHHSRSVST